MRSPKLKPCPFCGGATPEIRPNSIGDFFVICTGDDDDVHCGARTSDANCESPRVAIARWNARSKP